MNKNERIPGKKETENNDNNTMVNVPTGNIGTDSGMGTGSIHTIGSAVNSNTGTSGVTGEKSFQEDPDDSTQADKPEKTENEKPRDDKEKDKDYKPL